MLGGAVGSRDDTNVPVDAGCREPVGWEGLGQKPQQGPSDWRIVRLFS